MKQLIVIEPDLCTREALKAIFSADYALSFATDPESGSELLKSRADLLIIGLDRQGETAALLSHIPPGLPVLALSAAPAELKEIDVLTKPFNVNEIRSKVQQLSGTATEATPEETAPPIQPLEKPISLEKAVKRYERELIIQALEECNGVQTRAAEKLGTTRRILRYRIDKLNIQVPKQKEKQS